MMAVCELMLLCLAVSVLLHHLTNLRMYSHLLSKEPSVTWSHSTRERVSVCVCIHSHRHTLFLRHLKRRNWNTGNF